MRRLVTCTGLLLIAGGGSIAPARASSFAEVRRRVYEHPVTRLPMYDLPLAKAIFHALANMTGELIDRGRATLSDTSDFKPAAPKIIHPYGVCAEGAWTITSSSFATGLLSPDADGTPLSIRAMVRFSVANNAPVYKKGAKRNFGMAVKLFAANDENESVLTQNVFTLDQTGLTGDERPSIFFAPSHEPGAVYFTNSVAGKGFLAWLGQHTFEKLDPPSTIRALYPLAEVNAMGQPVVGAVSPALIRIVPRIAPKAGAVPVDFRDEILQYGPHELVFDLVLPVQYGTDHPLTIGKLELLQPVVSEVCDQELHFHHAPENRSLVK